MSTIPLNHSYKDHLLLGTAVGFWLVFFLMYKNEGAWNGQQIIAKEWVQKSLSPIVSNEQTDSDGYGYFFWHKTYEVNGKKSPCAYASGNGGNRVIIFEDLPIVIVITAMAYGKPYGHFQADEIVREYLLPAVL